MHQKEDFIVGRHRYGFSGFRLCWYCHQQEGARLWQAIIVAARLGQTITEAITNYLEVVIMQSLPKSFISSGAEDEIKQVTKDRESIWLRCISTQVGVCFKIWLCWVVICCYTAKIQQTNLFCCLSSESSILVKQEEQEQQKGKEREKGEEEWLVELLDRHF